MGARIMKIRVVIFDVYHTLLEIGPPPIDAAERWEFLWEDTLADPARLTLEEFSDECRRIIDREHAAARATGIAHPEVFWPAVAREALLELAHLDAAGVDGFLFRHAQLQRTVALMPGAAEVLHSLAKQEIPIGIASNAQPYTLHELDAALGSVKLDRDIFDRDLTFWSFASGFSKPDPHVFRMLSARLSARGIANSETLMVGDRLDNDVEPARAQGWQTWLMLPPGSTTTENAGDWRGLAGVLFP
jgi:FMN phosphatase YigB (HAD superfamily)